MKMKLLFSLAFLLSFSPVFTQTNYCSPNYLTSVNSYSLNNLDSVKYLQYATATNYTNAAVSLSLHVFSHKPTNDPLSLHPLIVFVHPGGYMTGNLNITVKQARLLALKGYVTSTIDYRLGWNTSTVNCSGDTVELKKAMYRAVQDINAAIRFLKVNAASYRIDTNYIFIAGQSAGAGACLAKHYFNQTDFNNWTPNIQSMLGGINSSGNNLVMSTTNIKGICNQWGALKDTSYIKPTNVVPLIAFHGDQDPLANIDTGRFNGCYTPSVSIFINGSRPIYNKTVFLGKCAEINIEIGGGHGVYNDTHIAERTACFFKRVICGACLTASLTNTVTASCSGNITGININPYSDNLEVFPNPGSGTINLQSTEFFEYTIINLLGEIVLKGEHKGNKTQISVASLPKGIYILKSEKFYKNIVIE